MDNYKQGIIYTASSYFLWGVLPLYWKMLDHVTEEEVLAHRVFWSFIFMVFLLCLNKQLNSITVEGVRLLKNPKLLLTLLLSSLLISINWFVYIWSVNNGHIVEASLGYYINPLISVLLGMIFLKERLHVWQVASLCLASLGVVVMTVHYGKIPWVALTLALSFGLYGLTKKLTNLGSVIGLTFETLVVTPIAAIYLIMLAGKGESQFLGYYPVTHFLLVGAGVATAVPLLLFASGAKRIPLFMIGILQYTAPTITLLIGIVVFKEPFTNIEFVTFTFIWCALILFTLSHSKYSKKVAIKNH